MAHAAVVAATGFDEDLDQRPTETLPVRQLVQIALYWLGINAIWGGMSLFVPQRIDALVGPGEAGRFVALQAVITMIMAAAVQPTVGSISDYTISRWGRRKPYIAIGASLDVLFIIGVATANTFVALLAFLVLLQLSSNFAQGPFQGYVPDLVPARQVGLASALVGMMQTLGFVGGYLIISLSPFIGGLAWAAILLGVVEFATAVGTLLWVREGQVAKHRRGRTWASIALTAWGLDILEERSFVFLVISRLMFVGGINVLTGFLFFFLSRTLALTEEERSFWQIVTGVAVAAFTVAATVPAARLSDRVGRKPVIYLACAVGAVGILIAAVAPSTIVFVVGAVLIGSASGTFLAVDWALMTDIIPKASSGRYMGISNLAVASGGPLASVIGGPLMDIVGGPAEAGDGPRAALLTGVALFVLAAVFLRRVDARPRDIRLAAAGSAA